MLKFHHLLKKYEESILYDTLKEIDTNFPVDFKYKNLSREKWENKSELPIFQKWFEG